MSQSAGAVDPISAVAGAISSVSDLLGKGIDSFTWKGKARYSMIPEYADPLDYQAKQTYTIEIIIGGLLLLFIVIGTVVALR